MAAKWFVDALEKADSRAKTVLADRAGAEGLALDSNGDGAGYAAQAQVAQDSARQRKVEQLAAQVKAKDAFIAQLEEDRTTLLAAKATEERRFQELVRALESDKEALRQRLEEEQQRTHDHLAEAGGLQDFHASLRRDLERAREEAREARQSALWKDEQWQSLQAEFTEYKARAAKLLQEKDRALQEMKTKSPLSNPDVAGKAASRQLEAERDEARRALGEARAEAEQLRQERETLVEQMVRMEADRKAQEQRHQAAVRKLEETVEGQLAQLAALRQEYDHQMEVAAVDRRQLMAAMKEKDATVCALEKRVQQLESDGQQRELEGRLQGLGERLMEKQKQLEKAHWERESLARQLEVTKERLQAAEARAADPRPLDVEAPFPPAEGWDYGQRLLGALSRRGTWGSRLASSSKALDRLGLQAGRVLRRSSLLRLLFLFYVVLLHFWVLIVLSHSALPTAKSDAGPG